MSSSQSLPSAPFRFLTLLSSSASSSSYAPIRRRRFSTVSPRKLNLKRLTSRIVHLTRRRQLHQIMEEIDVAKMNAVLEALVHCGDIDYALKVFDEISEPGGCGVDTITYGTLLKGLGVAGRIDEAFQLLESVERGTAVGRPKLSAPLIFGLLNAQLKQGCINVGSPEGAIAMYDEILRLGLNPDRLTYKL